MNEKIHLFPFILHKGKKTIIIRLPDTYHKFLFKGKPLNEIEYNTYLIKKSYLAENDDIKELLLESDAMIDDKETNKIYYFTFGTSKGVTGNLKIEKVYPDLFDLFENKNIEILKRYSWNLTVAYYKHNETSSDIKTIIEHLLENNYIFRKQGILINPYKLEIKNVYKAVMQKLYKGVDIKIAVKEVCDPIVEKNKEWYKQQLYNTVEPFKAEKPIYIKEFISDYSLVY
jgi:hypothetical protein